MARHLQVLSLVVVVVDREVDNKAAAKRPRAPLAGKRATFTHSSPNNQHHPEEPRERLLLLLRQQKEPVTKSRRLSPRARRKTK